MIDRLAAPSALDAGSGATEGQGRRCDPDHNGDVSRHSPTLKVCHFQLPKVCRFQLPLTKWRKSTFLNNISLFQSLF